jgi:hypothetical protein
MALKMHNQKMLLTYNVASKVNKTLTNHMNIYHHVKMPVINV